MARPLFLRNLTDSRGQRFDALLARGRLWRHGQGADGLPVLDAAGGRLLPGLVDAHLHLMATAAARRALDLSDVRPDSPALAAMLRAASAQGPVRAIGLDGAERLDAAALDRIVADGLCCTKPLMAKLPLSTDTPILQPRSRVCRVR